MQLLASATLETTSWARRTASPSTLLVRLHPVIGAQTPSLTAAVTLRCHFYHSSRPEAYHDPQVSFRPLDRIPRARGDAPKGTSDPYVAAVAFPSVSVFRSAFGLPWS